jgi:mannose-1-phosphate guanylyltransferase
VQRNTAPAIGLVAHILHQRDPGAVLGVFPSDHVIARPAPYRKLLRPAFRAAEQGKIVVLGIQPRWAETGYGYIEFPARPGPSARDVLEVRSFREKPQANVAQEYVDAGRFYWNAGMFFWRASVVLDQLRHHLPRTATLLASLPPFASRKFAAALAEVFPLCENISVDFAVLEKAANVAGIACDDIGWNDVGSWDAVYELQARDADNNAVPPGSMIVASGGNFVDARGKTVALLGVRDLIVVDTPDALLIADRKRAQEVASLVKMLEKANRNELL